MDELQALVDEYAQQGFWRHIIQACREATGTSGVSPAVLKFWQGFATAQEGNHAEALRLLSDLENQGAVSLASVACALNVHKQSEVKDNREVSRLKDELKKLSKAGSDAALTFAGRFFWHTGKSKQARQCLEKVLGKNKKDVDALGLFAWCNLTSGTTRNEKKAKALFDQVIKLDEKNLCGRMGRFKYQEMNGQFDKALDEASYIIANYPDFLPGLMAKTNVLFLMDNWESARSEAHRMLRKDEDDIGALRVTVLFLLAKDPTQGQATVSRVSQLVDAMHRTEPNSQKVFYEVSRLICRLAARKPALLELTLGLIQHAVQLDPNNSAYLSEHGYQLTLMGDYESAARTFGDASKLDEGNLDALHGRIRCKVMQGKFEEAQQELDFLGEITTMAANAELLFLTAKLAWNVHQDETKAVSLLDQAISEHLKGLEGVSPGYSKYITYNPDFVLEVLSEYMLHAGSEPRHSTDPPNPIFKQVVTLLQNLTDMVPGMLKAQLLLAKASFIMGEYNEADRALAACLSMDENNSESHLLHAQIYLARENYTASKQSLDSARSLDFEVNSRPIYLLLSAKLLDVSGKSEEALEVLNKAMDLPGVKRASQRESVPVHERIAVFVALATIQSKQGNQPEAAKTMSDAKHQFEKTSEACRITIADADMTARNGDHKRALGLLRSVGKDSLYYTRSKIRMAEIYLKYEKNRKLYREVYTALAKQTKTVHTFILLAEALMRIQEPEKAIQAFKAALTISPDDPNLASRIGRAYVTSHDYEKAVQYYMKSAAQDPPKIYLYHEQAQLQLQMGSYPAAIQALQQAVEVTQARAVDSLAALAENVKSHSLLAEVLEASGAPQESQAMLTKAWQLQQEVMSRANMSNDGEGKHEQKRISGELCFKLAGTYHKNTEKATDYFNTALSHDPTHEQSMLSLARLGLKTNNLDACHKHCSALLKLDPTNQEASMMLADVMFRKNEHQNATWHFQQLLEKDPTQYSVLEKLIELLRRAGRMSETPRFIKNAEKADPKAIYAPGFIFCKGILARFNNDAGEALDHFNYCRKDGEWGQRAIVHMIEIYLDPDGGLFQEGVEAQGDHSDHIANSKQLLAELEAQLPNNYGPMALKQTVLQAYCQMATKNNKSIDAGISLLTEILEEDKQYVPARLALANAFMIKGDTAKARNQLKLISKMRSTPEFNTEFEKGWLMLADIYISAGKYDLAQELCKKCLANNKSCAKAWEMMGLVMEKEQAYQDASDNYENAWKHMNESSPKVGYKLAFNYLKAKRLVEAIEVCHKVLGKYPNYPKIRKDIMDKARAGLRP